jgi:DNA-binding beta-propeller fold protein YncE
MKLSATLIVLLSAASPALAGEVKFTTKPTASKADGKVKISFTVSVPTDVEVAVLNAKGEVVRHLAAGVLGGKKAPPPPLKPGLSQALEWDMKDDRGKPAAGGPFKVRVRAGTGAKFGRVIGFDPYRMPTVAGLATDDKGFLYVQYHPLYNVAGWSPDCIRVFDSAGKYVKTIWPPPANLGAGRFAGMARMTGPDLDRGHLYPANYQPLFPNFLPENTHFEMLGNRVTDGRIYLLGMPGSSGTLVSIDADGGCPKDMVRGRMFALWGEKVALKRPKGKLWGPLSGAVSADGKTVYLAGLHDKSNKHTDLWKRGRVHAMDLSAPLIPVSYRKKQNLGLLRMKKFADLAAPPGKSLEEAPYCSWKRRLGMSAVHGLAVGPRGNLYACDRANDCIAVFDRAGKPLGKVAVKDPDQVAVHPKTGAIYVVTRGSRGKGKKSGPASLVKLSGFKDGREVARKDFEQPAVTEPGLALDSSGAVPGLWVSGIGSRGALVRFEDRGASFRKVIDFSTRTRPDGADHVWYCFVNPVTDEVFTQDGWAKSKTMARFDGKTGKRLPCRFNALEMAFDIDGNVYYSGYKKYSTPIWRLTPDLKPLPFPGSSSNQTAGRKIYGKYGCGHSQKGLHVARDGSLYALHMKTWSLYTVAKWTPDGKAVKGPVTGDFPTTRSGGLKMDAGGSLYMGMPGYPKSHKLPYSGPGDWFAGSVVKIKPGKESFTSGKKSRTRPASAMDWAGRYAPRWIAGALRAYPYQAPNGMSGRHLSCTCKEARFDLDRYGRLYIPNVLTYRVTMLDNSGNVILRMGHYGNADSMGPGKDSPIKKPAIPLGYPMTVGAAPDHNHVYVGDVVNTRVVRVDLTHQAEASCAVK